MGSATRLSLAARVRSHRRRLRVGGGCIRQVRLNGTFARLPSEEL
jgi:hypothetical protein